MKKNKYFGRRSRLVILCLILALSPFSTLFQHSTMVHAAGNIIYVKSKATGNNDGTSWDDAFNELQDALEKATAGDEIWIAAGTYYPSKDIEGNENPTDPRTKSFQMENNVTIYGGFPENATTATFDDRDVKNNETILSGDLNKNGKIDDSDAYHVFYHPQWTYLNPSAILDGVTITGGNANSYKSNEQHLGGGMYNNSSHPKLVSVTIKGNFAYAGGGVYTNNSDLILEDVLISENEADYGGGIQVYRGKPLLKNIIISDNVAKRDGGGLYNAGSNINLVGVKISKNVANSEGGGIYLSYSGKPILENVLISENIARQGGGMYNNSSDLIMEGGKVLENKAISTEGGSGGGIYNTHGWQRFNDVLIEGNEALAGGGVYNDSSSATFMNVKVKSNSASLGAGLLNRGGQPIIKDSQLKNNRASSNGGGIFNENSRSYLENVSLLQNTAERGGAMYNDKSDMQAINSELVDNEASVDGGGIYSYDSDATITNALFTGNKAKSGGGQFNNYKSNTILINITSSGNEAQVGSEMSNVFSNPTIQNSIIWGETNGLSNNESTPTFSHSLVHGSGGSEAWNESYGKDNGGNIDADPRFDFSTNDQPYRLQESSPAIDNGNNEYVPSEVKTDLAGNRRIMGNAVDMGAYEFPRKDMESPTWPQNYLYARSLGQSSVQLEWTPAHDNYEVTGYRIFVDETEFAVIDAPKDERWYIRYDVEGLKADTLYTFSVEAFDAAGNKSKKLSREGKTDKYPPEPDNEAPKWPENSEIEFTKIGHSSLYFTWPEATDNREVSYYRIYLNGEEVREYFSDSQLNVWLNYLKPETEYEIAVEAYDSWGNKSVALSRKATTTSVWAKDAEIKIESVQQSGIDISWPATTDDDDIWRFEVLVNGELYGSNPGDYKDYWVGNLQPDTEYELSVVAYNRYGNKIGTLTKKAVTAPFSDEEPPFWKYGDEIKGTEIKETSLKISWPKAVDNIEVTGYKVFVDKEEVADVTADTRTFAVTGLNPATTYTLSVMAYDEKNNLSYPLRIGVQTASPGGKGNVIVLPPAPTDPKPTDPKPDDDKKDFIDIKGHWAEKRINEATKRKLISGYLDDTFRPDNPINRAEFTIIIANALDLSGSGTALYFTDNRKIGASSRQAISRALEAGIVAGYEDGSFRPDAEITRIEMAAMISRALELKGDSSAHTGFNDDGSIPKWARADIGALRETKIIQGRGNNNFDPRVNATRAETVVMLLRMVDYLEK